MKQLLLHYFLSDGGALLPFDRHAANLQTVDEKGRRYSQSYSTTLLGRQTGSSQTGTRNTEFVCRLQKRIRHGRGCFHLAKQRSQNNQGQSKLNYFLPLFPDVRSSFPVMEGWN